MSSAQVTGQQIVVGSRDDRGVVFHELLRGREPERIAVLRQRLRSCVGRLTVNTLSDVWRRVPSLCWGVGLVTALAGCEDGSPADLAPDRFLEASVGVGTFLESAERGFGHIPDRLGDSTWSASLGSGAAGRAVYLAELFSATGDRRFLELARKQSWAALNADSTAVDNYSLYGGLGGIAFAAVEVGRMASDTLLLEEADRRFAVIVDASPRRGGRGWGPVNDVLGGAAGTGLALLHGYARRGDPNLLEAAMELGDTLLARADSLSDGRLRWQRGVETPLDLPNFSHGTAGVGFFMNRLGVAGAAPRFSAAAESAVRYLRSVAVEQDGLFLVPYGVPNDGYVTQFDIGWAHGPAGSARIHYADWITNRTQSAAGLLDRSARTILGSGVPHSTADSVLWTGPFQIDRRFGMAGIVPFLIDVSREFGEDSYSTAAVGIADHILERATFEAGGAFWSVPLYGFQGGEGAAVFTGYFYGAAGLGLAMLEAHYATIGRRPAIRLPDDPFGVPQDD